MKLVFFGPPGAGKGTIAKILNDKFGTLQISTGDLFRQAIKDKTPLGEQVSSILATGGLVPDSLTISIVKERVSRSDCLKGYILDGFPRTMVQAEEWEKKEPIDKAIYFKIDDSIVRGRLGGRTTCPKCGTIYGTKFNAPKTKGVCDKDAENLFVRPDDTEDAINNRLEVYHSQTKPLVEFYKKSNKIVEIDAAGSPEEVAALIVKALKL